MGRDICQEVGVRGAVQMRWAVQGNAWIPAQDVWEAVGSSVGIEGARPWKGQTWRRKTGTRLAS